MTILSIRHYRKSLNQRILRLRYPPGGYPSKKLSLPPGVASAGRIYNPDVAVEFPFENKGDFAPGRGGEILRAGSAPPGGFSLYGVREGDHACLTRTARVRGDSGR